MGFFDDLTPPEDKRSVCFLLLKCEQLGLGQKDVDALMSLVDDHKRWSATALTKALNTRGFTVSRGVIDRHRSGQCPCRKSNV